MIKTVIVTGASGFVGQAIAEAAAGDGCRVIAIGGPSTGGFDLGAEGARARLDGLLIGDPSECALVHGAAIIRYDAHPDALLRNAAMAITLGSWARDTGIGFSVLVSSVAALAVADPADRRQPATLYGAGKLAAEHAWRVLLEERQSIVRLAGVWGWQQRPGMFWNRLLLLAATGPQGPMPVIKRRASRRNYVSVDEAAACVVRAAHARRPETLLAAGADVVDNARFVAALEALPGSALQVEWQDDGGEDDSLYEPSASLRDLLVPFDTMMERMWRRRPAWAQRA